MSTDVSVHRAPAAAAADVLIVTRPVSLPPQGPAVPTRQSPTAHEMTPGPESTGPQDRPDAGDLTGRLARREALLHRLTLDRRRRRSP